MICHGRLWFFNNVSFGKLFSESLTWFIVGRIEFGDFLSYRLLLVELGLGYFTQMDFSDGCAQVLCEHSRSQKSFLEIAACFFVGEIYLPELFWNRLLLWELGLGDFTQMNFSDGCAQVLCDNSRSQKNISRDQSLLFRWGNLFPKASLKLGVVVRAWAGRFYTNELVRWLHASFEWALPFAKTFVEITACFFVG